MEILKKKIPRKTENIKDIIFGQIALISSPLRKYFYVYVQATLTIPSENNIIDINGSF